MSAADPGDAGEILDLLDRDLAGTLSLSERRHLYGLLAGRPDADRLIARALAFETAVADLKHAYATARPPAGLETRLHGIPAQGAAGVPGAADPAPRPDAGPDESS